MVLLDYKSQKVLPKYVLELADLFWTHKPKKDNPFYHSNSIGIEQYFGLEENHFDYFPASTYQTPIYWLLQYSLNETVDFIIEFTNKVVKHYAKSGFDSSVKKVKLFFDDATIKEQYISHCLWNIYRGTSSPVSPDLLQSIHMALEKFFLEMAQHVDSKKLERWLIYLLKNSESASIATVVASIVLAYPDKTFDVAKILFKTKEFILQDKIRLVSEYQTKSLYSIGYGLNYQNKIYEDERIKTLKEGIKEGIEKGIKLGEERGIEKGIKLGEERGIEKGARKEKIEIARQMLSRGLDISLVLEITGLPVDDIKGLI